MGLNAKGNGVRLAGQLLVSRRSVNGVERSILAVTARESGRARTDFSRVRGVLPIGRPGSTLVSYLQLLARRAERRVQLLAPGIVPCGPREFRHPDPPLKRRVLFL